MPAKTIDAAKAKKKSGTLEEVKEAILDHFGCFVQVIGGFWVHVMTIDAMHLVDAMYADGGGFFTWQISEGQMFLET